MGLAHGTIGWADVAVPDMDAGSAFYKAVFGWESIDGDGGESMPYRMFSKDGKLTAGMGPLTPDMVEAGQPPVWSAYVIVDDADAVYAKAVELGATPLMEVMDVMDAGRMFFMIDPVGAAIGVWESGQHDGAELFNATGAMTWNDLMCRDVDAATAFYTGVFGWNSEVMDMDGVAYTAFKVGDRMNGGLMDMSPFLPAEVPAHWMSWFVVEDCDATAATAVEAGGSVVSEPQDGGAGRTAVIADPAGAAVGIITPFQMDGQPPR